MPSASPSQAKRPSMQARTSSIISLSSSGKPVTSSTLAGTTKPIRPHLVSRHSTSRNVSHGRVLNNMGKKSMATVYGEARQHKRSKSGGTTPTASPRAPAGGHMKRNSSHVVLPKNRSHGNLRKNQSAHTLTALNRNLSRGALNKLGAPPEQKAKEEEQQKHGVFDLGTNDSEEEEEAEWEDSTASPELTRNNSKVSTPARAHTPNGEPIPKPSDTSALVPDEKTSSPPEAFAIKNNRSAPDLRPPKILSVDRLRQDPALLQQNGRASRAPPAMSTATARSSQTQLSRNDSQRSLARSGRIASRESMTSGATPKTPATPGAGTSSSASVGVSHFLPPDLTQPRTVHTRDGNDSEDDESVSDFMATYKPQPSESPEKIRTTIHGITSKTRTSAAPSRTQQKLELQRREVNRPSGPPPSSSAAIALGAGSSVLIHRRSASKGRSRTSAEELKIAEQDYEAAVRHLMVVRRFRNPVLESLSRLKQAGSIRSDAGGLASKTQASQKRPPSRHGRTPSNTTTVTVATDATKTPAGTTPEDREKTTKSMSFRPGGGRESMITTGNRVSFQLSRQGSHDDILTAGQGSPGTHHDDLNDGLSPEEALIRRMWESRIHVA